MMRSNGGLYKEWVEMLYSGALSAVRHKRVYADTAAVAPQQKRQNRAVFGPRGKSQQLFPCPAATSSNSPLELDALRAGRVGAKSNTITRSVPLNYATLG
jgi:hypothetical protein